MIMQRNKHDYNLLIKKWFYSGRLVRLLERIGSQLDFGSLLTTKVINRVFYEYIHASNANLSALFKNVLSLNRPLLGTMPGKIFTSMACCRLGKMIFAMGKKKQAKAWFKKCLSYIPILL